MRVQDVGLSGAPDIEVLAWAAQEGRAVVSHDVATLVGAALARAQAGLPMPGVVVVRHATPIGDVVDGLVLASQCSLAGEWEGRVLYLPFRD